MANGNKRAHEDGPGEDGGKEVNNNSPSNPKVDHKLAARQRKLASKRAKRAQEDGLAGANADVRVSKKGRKKQKDQIAAGGVIAQVGASIGGETDVQVVGWQAAETRMALPDQSDALGRAALPKPQTVSGRKGPQKKTHKAKAAEALRNASRGEETPPSKRAGLPKARRQSSTFPTVATAKADSSLWEQAQQFWTDRVPQPHLTLDPNLTSIGPPPSVPSREKPKLRYFEENQTETSTGRVEPEASTSRLEPEAIMEVTSEAGGPDPEASVDPPPKVKRSRHQTKKALRALIVAAAVLEAAKGGEGEGERGAVPHSLDESGADVELEDVDMPASPLPAPKVKLSRAQKRARALERAIAAAILGNQNPSEVPDVPLPPPHPSLPSRPAFEFPPSVEPMAPIILTEDSSAWNLVPQRKERVARTTTVLPTSSYLDSTLLPSELIFHSSRKSPPLLVLDLNHTLVHRTSGGYYASAAPIPRPYLATFISYVMTTRNSTWTLAVYSSAQTHNVIHMLSSISLVPLSKAKTHRRGEPWNSEPGEKLRLIWAREDMKLEKEAFEDNVMTVKDLSEIWRALGMSEETGAENTVLLDDEEDKAALQPYNHLPIKPFFPSTPAPRIALGSSPPPQDQRDRALLSTIYLLEVLAQQSNIAAFIRSGGLRDYQNLGEEELEKRGRNVCQSLGVEVKEKWQVPGPEMVDS